MCVCECENTLNNPGTRSRYFSVSLSNNQRSRVLNVKVGSARIKFMLIAEAKTNDRGYGSVLLGKKAVPHTNTISL